MVLVWSGRGYVVPAATFAASLAMELLTETWFQDQDYYQQQAWPLSAAFAIAGVASYTVGRSDRTSADPFAQPSLTPADVEPPRHTFFWIRAERWGVLLMLAAIANLLLRRG
jgi:hypothetical protein